MPDRPLTIATYAAGASLAAITLVYVFGPTFFFDNDAANSSKSSRKRGVVGLVNPANDCFINSVLQAFAGLPQLRTFLIKEVHRRRLDGEEIYTDLSASFEEERQRPDKKKNPHWKTLSLQSGSVAAGLKDILDALNEKPLYKKTISAQVFIQCVEQAFQTKISRTQQDAQEFFQIIIERLAEEYSAGKKARSWARLKRTEGRDGSPPREVLCGSDKRQEELTRDSKLVPDGSCSLQKSSNDRGSRDDLDENENSFPLEGKLESQVECSHCHFKPKPSVSAFLSLTLNVPHDSTSSSLDQCLDQLFKHEMIDDYKCDKCRLEHALQFNAKQLTTASFGDDIRANLESDRAKIQGALLSDPEIPPKGVELPDISTAPKRRISRHARISSFPQLLAIHLSRSVWDPSASSSKNMAKVSFPEFLPLGGLLDRKMYRLLGVVTHKGGHNNGHYESFRRQVLNPSISKPTSLGTEGLYSVKVSHAQSSGVCDVSSPQFEETGNNGQSESEEGEAEGPCISADPTQLSSFLTSATPILSATSHPPSEGYSRHLERREHQPPIDSIPTPGLPTPPQTPAASRHSTLTAKTKAESAAQSKRESLTSNLRGRHGSRKLKANLDRWWRISDDKIKESKTREVLSMQREVYMLFYEMISSDDRPAP